MILSRKLQERVDNLRIQAMMFDMDIDWETLSLMPKNYFHKQPDWILKWRERNQDKQWDHETIGYEAKEEQRGTY